MSETLSSLQDLKGAAAPAPEAAPRYVQKLDPQGRAYATGKRKDAVARVWIKPGPGKVVVNGRPLETYFARPVLRMILQQPLGVAKRVGQYDLTVTVAGRRPLRSGGRRASRPCQGAPQLRAGTAFRSQERGFLDARSARRRAQKIRQEESPPELPILETLSLRDALFKNQGGHRPPFSYD